MKVFQKIINMIRLRFWIIEINKLNNEINRQVNEKNFIGLIGKMDNAESVLKKIGRLKADIVKEPNK